MATTGPDEVLAALIDPGSFVAWRVHPVSGAPDHAVSADDDGDASVVIGEARVAGTQVALILSDFAVSAGSIGQASADRIVAALRTATERRLPVVASPASGGTRVQDGTRAFVRMIDIALAATEHRSAGCALLVWLRHPTTGGVMATWGSLGQITWGQPGALAGFLGPRLFEPLTGRPIPEGVQTTDNLARVGVIDAIVPLVDLRATVNRALDVMAPPPGGEAATLPDRGAATAPVRDPGVGSSTTRPSHATSAPSLATGTAPVPAWDAVIATRNPDRPGLRELMDTFDSVTALHGTGAGERCDAVRGYLARIGSHRCVVVGQDRRVQFSGTAIGPAGLRTAQRGVALAGELGLPLVSVIDTAGGELSREAEESAIAGEIARCLAAQASAEIPIVSLVLGMGCGGAALAMLPADRILAAELAWVSPLPVEGASLIRFRDTEHVIELAGLMRIDAASMLRDGEIDEVVPELPDAAVEPSAFIGRCAAALERNLAELAVTEPAARLAARGSRYGAGLRAERS